MPAKREYTKETIEIMNRFYEAVSVLILHKKIRGIQTYCNLAGIDRRHFYAQKKEISRGWFQMAWMLPLIKEFGVSSDWLLLGKGSIFVANQDQKQRETSLC